MGSSIVKGSGNFLDSFPIQETVHLAMLGLDSAGKTTALYRLKFDQYLNTVPTIGFNCEKVHGLQGKSKGIQFLVWDVGGQEKLRPLWRSYTRCTDGILFVVDSVDTERMEEAKLELMKTAKCPENLGVPVLILANKQDLPGARDSKELEKLLGLSELSYFSHHSSAKFNIDGSKNISTKHHNLQSDRKLLWDCDDDRSCSPAKPNSLSNCFLSSTSADYNTDVSFPLGNYQSNNRWYIQPTCAITGDGLQDGLEALYNMIIHRKKINRNLKKKR